MLRVRIHYVHYSCVLLNNELLNQGMPNDKVILVYSGKFVYGSYARKVLNDFNFRMLTNYNLVVTLISYINTVVWSASRYMLVSWKRLFCMYQAWLKILCLRVHQKYKWKFCNQNALHSSPFKPLFKIAL